LDHALRYHVTVPAHPVSIRFVRESTQAAADICGQGTAETLALVLSELVTNAVRHAAVATTENIDVTLEFGHEGVKGVVSDPGEGFEVDPAGPTPHDDGGFGLFIVDRLARDWGVDASGGRTQVWFEL
jgi:two-component sensor histidine kinase